MVSGILVTTLMLVILAIVVIGGIAGYQMKTGGRQPRGRRQRRYNDLRESSLAAGQLNQKIRTNEAIEKINEYHGKRKKSRLKWLRGETDESIDKERIREVNQYTLRLGMGRGGHFGSIHPNTGEIKSHGIGRAGFGTRGLIKPEKRTRGAKKERPDRRPRNDPKMRPKNTGGK